MNKKNAPNDKRCIDQIRMKVDNDPNLNIGMSCAEGRHRKEDGVQDGVDGGRDGPTVAISEEQVGQSCEDAEVGLSTHLGQDLIDGSSECKIDDLSGLHDLAGGDVEVGHVATNVGIANNCKKS